MNYEFESVDYEDMDDLALPDHIEFSYVNPEELFMDTAAEKSMN